MKRTRRLLPAMALPLLMWIGDSFPAEKSSWQLDWEKTVQAAKQEGQILIYAALGPYHPQIFAEFQKDYPEIKATIVHGNSSRISPRLLSERRAGKFLADVYLGGPTSLFSFYNACRRPVALHQPLGTMVNFRCPRSFLPIGHR